MEDGEVGDQVGAVRADSRMVGGLMDIALDMVVDNGRPQDMVGGKSAKLIGAGGTTGHRGIKWLEVQGPTEAASI